MQLKGDISLVVDTEILSDVTNYSRKRAKANASFQGYVRSKQGVATVEAVIVIPVFLFAMLAFISICNIMVHRANLYYAAAQATEYMAEYAYLIDETDPSFLSPILVKGIIKNYADDSQVSSRYIRKGIDGVSFAGSRYIDEDGNTDICFMYKIRMDIPFFGKRERYLKEEIKQKAYKGFKDETEGSEEEDCQYVYVAKRGVVYHTKRTCRYLFTAVTDVSLEEAKNRGKSPCEYCGKYNATTVFISESGERYHTNTSCSRLYRTVERKKLSEVGGIPKCSVCE